MNFNSNNSVKRPQISLKNNNNNISLNNNIKNLSYNSSSNVENNKKEIYDIYDNELDKDTKGKNVNIQNILSFISKIRKNIERRRALEMEFNEKMRNVKPYSKEYHDNYLDYRIKLAGGYGTREAVVASAKYLSEEYTVNGSNLPYFWGGKRLDKGVDDNWGSDRTITGSGTDEQPLGQSFPFGLDCSGFVSWALYNSGYDIKVYYSDGIVEHCIKKGGIDHLFNKDTINSIDIKEGDIVYRNTDGDDHIAIITKFDRENDIISFAEENGSRGLVVNEFHINEFVEKYYNQDNGFTGIITMENYYSNLDNLIK